MTGYEPGKGKHDILEDVQGPSGPAREVILRRSNVLSTRTPKRRTGARIREGSLSSRGGTQGMEREAFIRLIEGTRYEHANEGVKVGDQ